MGRRGEGVTRPQGCPAGSGPPWEATIREWQEAGRFLLQGRALGTEFFFLWTPHSWVSSGWGPHLKTSPASYLPYQVRPAQRTGRPVGSQVLDVIFPDMGMSSMDPSVKRWLVSETLVGTECRIERLDSEGGNPRSAERPREYPFPF